MANNDVTYEIIERVGILEKYQTGWSKELNIVSWNGGEPKYDIRDWSEDHEKMSKGVTLTSEQMRRMTELAVLRGIGEKPKEKDYSR